MRIEKLTARIGAEITGVDASRELDEATIDAIAAAFHEHSVVILTGQKVLSADRYLAFASRFGPTEIDDFQTHASERPEIMVLDQIAPKGQGSDRWHADTTYRKSPPVGIMIQAKQPPEHGGDTLFASMYAAYEELTPTMQRMLEGLTALHSTQPLLERTRDSGLYALPQALIDAPPISHPVIATHPVTGRRYLNVNAQWTTRIEGLSEAESKAILDFLFEHIKSPETQVRHRWRKGDIAFWDNTCLQHYAVADYTTRRVVQRIVLEKVRGGKSAQAEAAEALAGATS